MKRASEVKHWILVIEVVIYLVTSDNWEGKLWITDWISISYVGPAKDCSLDWPLYWLGQGWSS